MDFFYFGRIWRIIQVKVNEIRQICIFGLNFGKTQLTVWEFCTRTNHSRFLFLFNLYSRKFISTSYSMCYLCQSQFATEVCCQKTLTQENFQSNLHMRGPLNYYIKYNEIITTTNFNWHCNLILSHVDVITAKQTLQKCQAIFTVWL